MIKSFVELKIYKGLCCGERKIIVHAHSIAEGQFKGPYIVGKETIR